MEDFEEMSALGIGRAVPGNDPQGFLPTFEVPGITNLKCKSDLEHLGGSVS